MTSNDPASCDRINPQMGSCLNSSMNTGKNNAMYELEYPGPLRGAQSSQPLPMIIALQGYADAGQAISQASGHVLQALDHQTVASFRLDDLIDYRARRPGVTIDHSRLVDREQLELSLHLIEDTQRRPFLLLSGPEPDMKWEAFSDSVVELAQRCSVSRIVAMYAAPMTVPHTRPLMVSAHSSHPELLENYHTWEARMIIPGSAALDTELKLIRKGFPTVGVTAHVPHYIAASDYPAATKALLKAAGDLTDRSIPLSALDTDIARVSRQLEEQVGESHEISTVVAALERKYDDELALLQRRKENNLLKPGQEIPTGEQLGAELEAFLAELYPHSDARDTNNEGSETHSEQLGEAPQDSSRSTDPTAGTNNPTQTNNPGQDDNPGQDNEHSS